MIYSIPTKKHENIKETDVFISSSMIYTYLKYIMVKKKSLSSPYHLAGELGPQSSLLRLGSKGLKSKGPVYRACGCSRKLLKDNYYF